MKTAKRFKIVDFSNPSGARSYRVTGTLDGQTIRKNFKSKSEAIAFRQRMDIEFLNQESDGQTVWTTLTQDQNREAIAAVNLLKRAGSTKPLSFAVQYLLEHYKEAEENKSPAEAAEIYLKEKVREVERGIIIKRQERAIRLELNKFSQFFDGRVIGEIISTEIREYLDSPIGRSKAICSPKTWNNRRGYLSTFFKFCLSKKFIDKNPILDVPQYKIKKARGTADTLSAIEAKELMHFLQTYKGKQNKSGSWWGVEGCMVPYFALTLFAGIRPDYQDGEISKLKHQDIRIDTGVILIEPEVSKVNEKRSIDIQPNLKAWLKAYPISQYPILTSSRFSDMLIDIRKCFALSHDVMRHTFISMHVGKYRSVGDASLQAGNSESVIRKHYLNLKTAEEATVFWDIFPALPKLRCNSFLDHF
jgi:integrase